MVIAEVNLTFKVIKILTGLFGALKQEPIQLKESDPTVIQSLEIQQKRFQSLATGDLKSHSIFLI